MILTAQLQRGDLCIWALVDDDADGTELWRFAVYGTGHDCEEDPENYIATFQLFDGDFIGHLFGRKS